jgi:hypothetical protein
MPFWGGEGRGCVLDIDSGSVGSTAFIGFFFEALEIIVGPPAFPESSDVAEVSEVEGVPAGAGAGVCQLRKRRISTTAPAMRNKAGTM